MKFKGKDFVFFGAVALAIAMIGCGGGGTSGGGTNTTGNPTTGTTQQLKQATADLNTAFSSSTYSTSTFQKAATEFSSLASCGDVDPRIDAGYVIASIILKSLQEYAAISGNTTVSPKAAPFTDGILGSMFSTNLAFHNPLTIPDPVKSIVSSTMSPTGLPPTTNFKFELSQLPADQAALASLNTLIKQLLSCELTDAHINALESTPLVLTIPSPNTGVLVTVKVGSAELYSLRAALYFIATILDGVTSYDLNPGSFSLDNLVSPVLAEHLKNGNFTLPGTLLPPAPFMTRTTDFGTEQQTFMTDGATDLETVSTIVSGRAANSGYLLNALLSTAQVTELKAAGQEIQTALTSTLTASLKLNNKEEPMQVSLSNYFKNRPANMESLLPVVFYNGKNVLIYDFPDPTFGGLFLNGVAQFQNAYGNPPYNIIYDSNAVTATTTFRQWYGGTKQILGN